ncbi:MAG: DUF4184 family protein [Magnetococcales bacterium]|nr:DUF4184 family protein [Magnetococcales bacterium]
MPFTLSHAALAVPLARRLGLPLSPLVIGSFSPDFPIFVFPFSDALRRSIYAFTHSWLGCALFGLVAGMAALYLFHAHLKGPMIRALPPAIQQRLAPHAGPYSFAPGRGLLLTLLALLLGAWSHLFWDSFTHHWGFFVNAFPLLKTRLLVLPEWDYTLHVYKLLQHVSSLGGLALLGVWIQRWLRQEASPNLDASPDDPLGETAG